MTTETQAFKAVSWLAAFKVISQILSWGATIFVARMLVPADYGLMAMATVITGYAMLFSELGLGAAIIQRTKPTSSELSSIFWFALAVSLFFSLSCLLIAYPTAWLFDEPRVIPVTQSVSVLFLLAGLQVVPLNLLKKQLRFKEVGRIEAVGVIFSCFFMLVAAYLGAGVWTLIGGNIVRALVSLLLVYRAQTWKPTMLFKLSEALFYMNFGIHLALGSSVGYVNNKSDTFFAGRVWLPEVLGLYSFARQLSKIPNDKFVSLINQVAFPAFARMQDDKERFNRFYLDINKAISVLVFPLFFGGFLVGEDLVRVLFDEKWYPMIYVFKFMCLSEVITPFTAVCSNVHGAQGRSRWFLAFNLVMLCFMPLSFFLVVPYGLHAMILPWFTSYLSICMIWNYVTLRKINIRVGVFIRNLSGSIGATILMAVVIWGYGQLRTICTGVTGVGSIVDLIAKIALGGGAYVLYFLIFDRKMIKKIKELIGY